MTHEELKKLDQAYTMQTYGRFDVDIDHGKGAALYDLSGKEYIDFTSGIGVCSIGYADPRWVEAISAQAARLAHVSNLFYTQPYAESNEGLIKLARKYSFDRYGKGRGTILTLKNSFHGRTISTLTATGQDVFHNYFFPFDEGFRYAEAGDMDSLQSAAGHDVCAVLLELVQGEGGVLPMEREYVNELAELCQQRDWLLLVDEVQTGIGRTGTLFAFQQYGIQPDAVSFAKGIAGGLPMGGILASERCRNVFTPGTHATTFGGNPICAAAAQVVLEILDDSLLTEVTEKGAYIRERIERMDLECLGGTRGLGMMIGVEVKRPYNNKELAARLMEQGLLVLTAGRALRLLPPLTIRREEIDKGLTILEQALA